MACILRPLGNVVVLMPPLSISRAELKLLLDVTYEEHRDSHEGIGIRLLLREGLQLCIMAGPQLLFVSKTD